MDIVNPLLNNEYLTEFIYKRSPITPFIQSVSFDRPEFYVQEKNEVVLHKMEKFSVKSSFDKEYKSLLSLDEVLMKMIDDIWWMIQKHYINYIDKNSTTEFFSFYKDAKIPIRLFRSNVRYSFINDDGRKEHKKAINFLSMLSKSRDIFDDDEDENMFLITSPEIASYLRENPSINLETMGAKPHSRIMYYGGTITNDFQSPFILKEFPVFVNPSFNKNIAYIGTTKRYNNGMTLFYYQSKDVFSKYEHYDNRQTDFILNIQYKFAELNNITNKFKKIIFET